MSGQAFSVAVSLAGLLGLSGSLFASSPQSPPTAPADLAAVLAAQVPLDFDGDGFAELAGARLLARHSVASAAPHTVLVFVEPRLLVHSAQREGDPLRAALEQLTADIARENGEAALIELDCPPAPRHQDGLYVLALRRLLRACRLQDPTLGGVLFVGHFPEALLVRNCNWRKLEPLTLRGGTPEEKRYSEAVPYLRTRPELVAQRCETVLADLDGDWESCYVQPRTALPWSIGVFPEGVPAEGGWAEDFETGTVEFEDFFHVDDGRIERKLEQVRAADGSLRPRMLLDPLDEQANQECSATDRARANPMAVPEILVSRIDAHGVGLALRPELRDAAGLPQAGTLEGNAKPNWHSDPWVVDPGVELDLLLEYLQRNHAYRDGSLKVAFRPASLSHGLPSGFNEVRAASPTWKDASPGELDQSEVDLCAAATWLEAPALLRTIRAHSDAWGSVFAATDVKRLAEIAGPPWSFAVRSGELVPSLGPACSGGKLDFFLLETLHANRRTAGGASFYLHTGCEAISPPGAEQLAFNAPGYGLRNGAEALLFLADGLALVGRAKVFYDEPRGFCETLAAGETVGAAWRRYFELESCAASMGEVGGDIGRKRAYFWSVLGDWTLRLRRDS